MAENTTNNEQTNGLFNLNRSNPLANLFSLGGLVSGGNNQFVFLSLAVILGFVIILVPIPGFLLDFLMIINLVFSILILLTVLNVKMSSELFTFPTILLMATGFRLAINLSSTRLILAKGGGFDGQVVNTFAQFVTGGSFVIGLIIFIIILVVQFLVIAKGGERAAEVSARFNLDALPGKQMSIDADLASGNIDNVEAEKRRKVLAVESAFYGNMDGASKFISGEVRASLVITLVNIIAGLIVGVVVHNESFADAAGSYVRFAIGDGLVASLPALCLSIASGILITKGNSDNDLAQNFREQFFIDPLIFFVLGGFVFLISFISGFPKLVFYVISALCFYIGYQTNRNLVKQKTAAEKEKVDSQEQQQEQTQNLTSEDILKQIQVDPLEIEIGYYLFALANKEKGGDLIEKIRRNRHEIANELGLVIPNVRLLDNMSISENEYRIKLFGEVLVNFHLEVDKLLAIKMKTDTEELVDKEMVLEPSFGLPAYWIDPTEQLKVEKKGYQIVDPPSVLSTHFMEVVKRNAHRLLGRNETRKILDIVKETNKTLVEEIEKANISLSLIQKVLRELLKEDISIRNIFNILETICDYATYDHETISERVRESLNRQISAKLSHHKVIDAVILTADVENRLMEGVTEAAGVKVLNLDLQLLQEFQNKVLEVIKEIPQENSPVVLLVSSFIRKPLEKILRKIIKTLPIIAVEEIAESYQVNVIKEI